METEKKRLEGLVEVGLQARREVEDFLNRSLDDNTKGWAVRTDLAKRYKDQFSVPLVIYLN